mgnify:CR=1 FL=1
MSQTSPIRKIENETQYDAALARIEELLPLVSDETPIDNPASVELVKISKLVSDYEDVHYPIGNKEISQVGRRISTELNIDPAIVLGV